MNLTGEVVSEGIFSVDGTVLEVNGERVLVMDYGDADALDVEAAGISPTGSSVATHGQASMILWDAPPHFFRTETAIVLYVGDSPKVIEALTSVLGPSGPLAGRGEDLRRLWLGSRCSGGDPLLFGELQPSGCTGLRA